MNSNREHDMLKDEIQKLNKEFEKLNNEVR